MSLPQLREMIANVGDRTLRELASLEAAKSRTVSAEQIRVWRSKEGAR